MAEKNKTVEVAKEIATEKGSNREMITSSGVRIKLVPVSTALIDEVTSRIHDPEIPMWHNEAKDRDEPNPSDPNYLRAVEAANRERGVAVLDAMCMFGVELLDGLPEDSGWLAKLKFLERRGQVDLSGYDTTDPLDLEFLYKRYIAVDTDLISKISSLSSVSAEAVSKQEGMFRGN